MTVAPNNATQVLALEDRQVALVPESDVGQRGDERQEAADTALGSTEERRHQAAPAALID